MFLSFQARRSSTSDLTVGSAVLLIISFGVQRISHHYRAKAHSET